MRSNILTFLRRALKDQSAQVLPMMAFLMIGFFGMAAFVIDVGSVYYSYNELVASTNAAAMAGAQGLATSGTQATTNAALFNSQAGGKNAHGNLTITSYTPTLGCVSDGIATGTPCIDMGSGVKANAIQIKQTATVKTYFAALIGTPSITLTATATALMGSPGSTPENIVVLLDTTQSMSDSDTSCGAKNSRLSCALDSVQTLLEGLHPCTIDGCGALSSDNYKNALDEVSLFTFPEMTNTSQTQYETDCIAKTTPSITPYTFPSQTATTYTPGQNGQLAATYQVTPFETDYQSISDGEGSGSLNGSGSGASGAVEAVGGGGCAAGMGDPGGEGTYYAGALWAAQAALLAEQAARQADGVSSQNAIIVVSDGAATASSKQMSGASKSGSYASYNNECLQGVTAANSIKSAGTTIYTVAYGAQTSGCTTDTGKYTSPCYAMQQMASPPSGGTSFFYSDNEGGTGNCSPDGTVLGGLGDIMGSIISSFGPPRLIPNNTFGPTT